MFYLCEEQNVKANPQGCWSVEVISSSFWEKKAFENLRSTLHLYNIFSEKCISFS